MKNVVNSKAVLSVASLLALALMPQMALGQDKPPAKEPANVKYTRMAWDALEKGDFDGAIKNAKVVIDDFAPDADADQEKLKKSHAPEPPLGPAANKKEEQDTLRRGPLNDVATCYWIMGQAYQKKGDATQEKAAYQAGAKYTYARTWDPDQRIFWSPADKAAARLKKPR